MTNKPLNIELIVEAVNDLDKLLEENDWTRRDEIRVYRDVNDKEISIVIDVP